MDMIIASSMFTLSVFNVLACIVINGSRIKRLETQVQLNNGSIDSLLEQNMVIAEEILKLNKEIFQSKEQNDSKI